MTLEELKINKKIVLTPTSDIVFCYNPEPIKLKAEENNIRDFIMTVEISCPSLSKSFKDIRHSHVGKVETDISPYTKLFFNRDEQSAIDKISPTGKKIEIKISFVEKEDYDKNPTAIPEEIYSYESYCIWGALNIGDTFNDSKTLTWYKNFPFTVSFYHAREIPGQVRHDQYAYTPIDALRGVEPGIVNLSPNDLFGDKDVTRYAVIRMDYGNEESLSVFSRHFDHTFHPTGNGTLQIRLNVDTSTEGTYLRWMDSHGFFRYYLFTDGDINKKTKNEGKELYETYAGFNGKQHHGAYRVQGKDEEKIKKLCAPLISQAEFDDLESLLTSPMVDMFMGYNKSEKKEPVFVPINVNDGNYILSGDNYKDFEIEITLPKTINQELL